MFETEQFIFIKDGFSITNLEMLIWHKTKLNQPS